MLRFWTRYRLRQQPLPATWQAIVEECLPLYRQLPEPERRALHGHLQVFLAEKRFEGCGGIEVTEAMRVTVAAHACLLLLRDPAGYYPLLGTVVFYPRSFAAPIRDMDDVGIVTDTIEERLGESWQEGTVVLAWDAIEALIRGESADCNVIIHEFAHQIDARRNLSTGSSLLVANPRYRSWQEFLVAAQQRQRNTRRRGQPAILDPYAVSGVEELFAVASETFFMRPVRLKVNHPELYAELRAVYGVDPAGWVTESTQMG